jgi:hypothetical protein
MGMEKSNMGLLLELAGRLRLLVVTQLKDPVEM